MVLRENLTISTTKLAVFGDPIQHSLSPRIHTAFATQFGIPLTYEKIKVPKGCLAHHLAQFVAAGGTGVNITTPLKSEAFALVTNILPSIKTIGALNTLAWQADKQAWLGDNTDGLGFVHYISQYLELDLQTIRVLLLGAGGAARAIIQALLEQGVGSLVVLNRDLEKVNDLNNGRLQTMTYTAFNQDFEQHEVDLIVNATSCSLTNTLPPLASECFDDKWVVDLAYKQGMPTKFMTWAKLHGAKQVEDGLGMLVEQAALSFALWFQEKPHTHPIYQQLRTSE